MALSRKYLSALGIEQDKVDEIIQAHAATADGLTDEIDKYKGDAEKLPGVQKELEKLQEAAKDGGKNAYEVKYNALKEEYAEYKKTVTEKETKARKNSAYRALLKEAGVSDKRIDAVLKVSDVDGIEFDENGDVKDKDSLISGIKEEWEDFITTTRQEGAKTSTPPDNAGKKLSREDIYKTDDNGRFVMDANERQKALAQLMSEE